MVHLQEQAQASQRRACQVVEQPRATQRYRARRALSDRPLVKRLRELAGQHPRYGYRRIAVLLRRQGWRINRKRVQRLWREEGLKVPQKQRKRRRLAARGQGPVVRRAERPNQVWSYDFVWDQTANGRLLKWLPIVDEYTRECLRLPVARQMKAVDVVERLRELVRERGAPAYLRSDNGPEFVARAVKEWLASEQVATLYIEPGSPWENAYVESFNSRLRDELLDREVFDSVAEARVLAEQYRREHNERRPHSALGYQTPREFALASRAKFSSPSGEETGYNNNDNNNPKSLTQVGT